VSLLVAYGDIIESSDDSDWIGLSTLSSVFTLSLDGFESSSPPRACLDFEVGSDDDGFEADLSTLALFLLAQLRTLRRFGFEVGSDDDGFEADASTLALFFPAQLRTLR
jgi:hypothetical protein